METKENQVLLFICGLQVSYQLVICFFVVVVCLVLFLWEKFYVLGLYIEIMSPFLGVLQHLARDLPFSQLLEAVQKDL